LFRHRNDNVNNHYNTSTIRFPKLYLTNLLWLVFSLVFAFLLRRRARRSAITKVVIDSEDYKIHHGDEEKALE
jgi:hypothetical protein